jgi:hypothetical protein
LIIVVAVGFAAALFQRRRFAAQRPGLHVARWL